MADEVTIKFKTTKGTKDSVQICLSATIADLKAAIAEKLENTPVETQRLIYKGRVMKDNETCESYGLSDGQMVIVVSKKPKVATQAAAAPAAPQAVPQVPPRQSNAPEQPAQAQANPQANPFAGFNPAMMGGMPGMMGGMPGGMNGMAQNPEMVAQMLQNPMVQQMMQQMAQNPEMLQQMINQNPMLRQMAQNNPQMQAMLNNPQMLQAMMNPQMMQAAVQMQAAMQQMQQAQQAAQAPAQPANPAEPAAPQQPAANPFAAMFANMPQNGAAAPNMFGMPMAQPNPQAVQEQRTQAATQYTSQLQQLSAMGFTDADANLDALIMTGGNVQAALNRLLG